MKFSGQQSHMEEIAESFKNTYDSEAAYGLVSQIGDATLDVLIDKGVLDGVPILGVLNGAYKATKNFQLYRLMKKVYRFVFLTRETSLEERKKFIDEYAEINKEEGCEVLLTVIAKLDNTNKIDILVNLMKAKIRGNISIKDFIRLTTILERIPFSDLSDLHKYENDYFEDGSTDVLLSAGVLYNTIIDVDSNNKYRLNSLGALLLRYGLEYNINDNIRDATHLIALEWQES